MKAPLRSLFSFPNPVNEVAARVVAGGVLVQCVLAIALRPDPVWPTPPVCSQSP